MSVAQEGDLALLIGPDKRRFIIRLVPGQERHTHRGVIKHDDLIGQPYGREVQTHIGQAFMVLRPSLHDLIMNVKRITQIIYPKEIGHILLKLSVGPGSRIIEAGTGSGGLTLALAHMVRPAGRVYSYEERPEMSKAAARNLERVGLAEYVELKVRDIGLGFDEREVDALFLDVREPWMYLAQAKEALATGGFFGSLVPTTNQVQDLLQHLEYHRFSDIEVLEILVRGYKPVPERLRPTDRMIAHTGFLIFARSTDRSLECEAPALAEESLQEPLPLGDADAPASEAMEAPDAAEAGLLDDLEAPEGL
ncbi:MAG: tRNA (adenine-N1)-methyltransferase [Chloroflexi bacterium]|nr:tRNA (adenine-N1)-methyltransferase [Chloroflexota bacterium]